MDALIVAGLSKSGGSHFGARQEIVREGQVMNYSNLRKYFGADPGADSRSDYSTPYLAGILLYNYLTRRGMDCGLIYFLDREEDRLERYLRQDPKVIALSSSFLTDIRAVKKVTRVIRGKAPGVPIVLGGPLVFNSYLLYLLKDSDYETKPCARDYFFLNDDPEYHRDIDWFVIEEQGEETLYRILKAVKEGRDVRSLPNLAYHDGRRWVFTPREIENNDLSEDWIDWEGVPEEYLYPVFPLRGSRGCPYRCRYCNFSPVRRFRLKSAEAVGREVQALVRTGKVRWIRFTDDNLFLSPSSLERYCRKIQAVGKGVRWSSFIRASSITRENVTLLKDSGCSSVMIGMESGNASLLKAMNKRDRPEHYEEVVGWLNRAGISTQLTFIIGFPGETEETIQDTVALINRFYHQGPAVNEITVFPFGLAPLSPIYRPDHRKRYGLSGYMHEWSHRTMDSQTARQHAEELFLRVRNVHYHYGIGEFLQMEMPKMKRVAELRSLIRRGEMSGLATQELEGLWGRLKEAVLS